MSSDRPLARVCIRLYQDDYDFLEEVARATNSTRNLLIRKMVSNYVLHIRDMERGKIDKIKSPKLQPVEIELTGLGDDLADRDFD